MKEIRVAEIDDKARQNRQAQADAQNPPHRAQFLALACILGIQINRMLGVVSVIAMTFSYAAA